MKYDKKDYPIRLLEDGVDIGGFETAEPPSMPLSLENRIRDLAELPLQIRRRNPKFDFKGSEITKSLKKAKREGLFAFNLGPDELLPLQCRLLQEAIEKSDIESAVWIALTVGIEGAVLAERADASDLARQAGQQNSAANPLAKRRAFELCSEHSGPRRKRVGEILCTLELEGFGVTNRTVRTWTQEFDLQTSTESEEQSCST